MAFYWGMGVVLGCFRLLLKSPAGLCKIRQFLKSCSRQKRVRRSHTAKPKFGVTVTAEITRGCTAGAHKSDPLISRLARHAPSQRTDPTCRSALGCNSHFIGAVNVINHMSTMIKNGLKRHIGRRFTIKLLPIFLGTWRDFQHQCCASHWR